MRICLPAVCGLLLLILAFSVGCKDAEVDSTASRPSTLAFTDVTEHVGLGGYHHVTGASGRKWLPETTGSGGGFIDYDGDGRQDILLVGGGTWPESEEVLEKALWLYRMNEEGMFVDVTRQAGLAGIEAYGMGVAIADYDNDGDFDFYFSTLTGNMLFRNDGGMFTEVGKEAGVAGESQWSTSSIFFDADRDGYVDLFVSNYVYWSPQTDIFCSLDGVTKVYCTPEMYDGVPSRFYRNNGDGTFTDATKVAGFFDGPGKSLGVAELDFNGDGWPDLIVANDMERDLLYQNNQDGTFTEKGELSGIAYDEYGQSRAGMGVDAGAVDNTGETSIFTGNFSKEMIGVYRHLKNGHFVDRATTSGIGQPSLTTLTFGLFLFDVDLDTDLDLFAANGHVQSEIEITQEGIDYAQAPHLFINNGEGKFEDVAPTVGGVLKTQVVARGAAYADYDGDGDLDVLITENAGRVYLWRNELREAGSASTFQREISPFFIRVNLAGRESNRAGISSRVVAVVDSIRMERRVRSGSSYLSQSEFTVTFGLGDAKSADSLIVKWPSGHVDVFNDVGANKHYRIVEGSGRLDARSVGLHAVDAGPHQ